MNWWIKCRKPWVRWYDISELNKKFITVLFWIQWQSKFAVKNYSQSLFWVSAFFSKNWIINSLFECQRFRWNEIINKRFRHQMLLVLFFYYYYFVELKTATKSVWMCLTRNAFDVFSFSTSNWKRFSFRFSIFKFHLILDLT